MSKRGNAFIPMDTGPPPTMDFAFANPQEGQSRGTPTPRDYFPETQSNYSIYEHNIQESNGAMSPDPPVQYAQTPLKRLKPGPISRSELSSSANAFKLRADNALVSQKSASRTRLRQEVFKKPHTLALPPQGVDTIASERSIPTLELSTSGDAVIKVLNKQAERVRGPSSSASPSPSPFFKSEPSAFPDTVGTPGRINAEQRRRSSAHGKTSLLSRPVTRSLVEELSAPSFRSKDSVSQAAAFSAILDDPPRVEARFHTPARGSVVPTTPTSDISSREDSSTHALRRKCELYEVDQKFDRDLIESQSQVIVELSNKNTQMEEKTRSIESKYAAEVKEIRQRANASLVKLTDLQENFSQTSASQIKELKQSLDKFRQEIRDSMNAIEPLLVGYDEMKSALREIAEEHEQQVTEKNDEKIKLQQTNDLLRDQLADRTGSYTESLEREKELQASLVKLGESHANVAKTLSTLHKQHDQINMKYTDSKVAESSATKRVGELEGALTSLKIDNARMKSLITDNEQASSHKLQALEEQNDRIRTSLDVAHKELSASKNEEQAAHSQVHALLREKENLLQRQKSSNSMLEGDLDLRTRSLAETRAKNQVLESQLNDEKRNLEKARAEADQMKGQLVEKDRAISVQVQELNTALESYREREILSVAEIAALNGLISRLRERVNEADEADLQHCSLKESFSEKCSDIERIELENGRLQSQVVQLKLERDAIKEEVRQLHETGCVARERETAARKELQDLRQSLKEHRDANEKANISIARMDASIEQIKVTLEKEKDAHRLTEKQREASLLNLGKLQAEQKVVLDKASTVEKKLRSSVDESQERIRKLELERAERENGLKQLRHELDTANSAKATLETLVSEFRTSVQQVRFQREKADVLESKLTALSNQVSSQKTELRLLEQQLADANSRLVESRADTSAYRAAAESARASAAVVEGQLKHKEKEIEAIRTELQSQQTLQVSATTDGSPTSPLHKKIIEQEDAIKILKSQILELKDNSETIVERYRGGKLTNSEKDLVGVITAGIVQDKNRIINNLKGELKRAELKTQLESDQSQDPASWQPVNHRQIVISSSPLSELAWHAPDHDPPAPDSPAVQLAERPLQNPRDHEQPPQNNLSLSSRLNPQQHRILAPTRPESGNATDEIQEFEEPETPHNAGTTNRKRTIVSFEPLDDEDQEEHERETRRKSRAKAKRDNKAAGESSGPKGPPNKADGPSTSMKAKATKRRKV